VYRIPDRAKPTPYSLPAVLLFSVANAAVILRFFFANPPLCCLVKTL
jgi:hypothetical protein